MARLLSIGRLARAAEVSTDTIRYYEQIGLLPAAARSPGGYRLYPPTAVRRLQLIRRARALGLALAEIRDLLEEEVTGFGTNLQRELLQRLPTQLTEAERRVVELRALRDELLRHQAHSADADTTRTGGEDIPPGALEQS